MMNYQRQIVARLEDALLSGPPLLQVVTGPRQVGKTTAAEQLSQRLGWPGIFEAADVSPPPGPEWIETHWTRARALPSRPALLVLDEVQKVRGWSETVKRLWDEEKRSRKPLSVILLGSSALQLREGMSESLAGRFFLHRCMHWSLGECAEAFGWGLDQWIFFGGYPGAARLAKRQDDWAAYISDSLIETALARDVFQMHTVAKPALLRALFGCAAAHPAQIFSYNKMLGQLVDAGNTTTLAHYLDLLETAYLASGLPLFSAGAPRRRAGSPKLILWNNALINAFCGRHFSEARQDSAWWGRLIENAVGAHLLNGLPPSRYAVSYWREGGDEVDFVVTRGTSLWAIEVKSGRSGKAAGLAAFRERKPRAKILLVGPGGIPLEEFFRSPPETWLQ